MLRIFTQLFVILVLWAGLGAATYWLHPRGRVLLAGGQAAVPQDETEVSLSEAKRLAMDGKVLWIDVRPAAEFAAEHVPGAENVPADQAGVLEGKLFEWTQSDRLRPDTTLVIYCASPGCGSAHQLRQQIVAMNPGLRVLVLAGGWTEWKRGEGRAES